MTKLLYLSWIVIKRTHYLVAARDGVIGEHHMVKWAIVKILIESFTFIS